MCTSREVCVAIRYRLLIKIDIKSDSIPIIRVGMLLFYQNCRYQYVINLSGEKGNLLCKVIRDSEKTHNLYRGKYRFFPICVVYYV